MSFIILYLIKGKKNNANYIKLPALKYKENNKVQLNFYNIKI